MLSIARKIRRTAVALALLASASFAQAQTTLPEVVVTPLRSPVPGSGLGPMFMSHFFSQVTFLYPTSYQANRIMCEAAKRRAQDRGCALPSGTVDIQLYLKNQVFNVTLLGGINPNQLNDIALVYAYALGSHGVAGADAQLRADITAQCAARYDGALESTCANEAFGRMSRPWREGGLAGITASDVENVSRGLECAEFALDADEFCGIQY